jgi:hypothetical protein
VFKCGGYFTSLKRIIEIFLWRTIKIFNNMNFTKEQLLETLKAKLKEKVKTLSISERTLQSQIETLFLFAGEGDELEDFSEKVLPSVVSLDGNYRKDNADFAKEWEKSHPQPAPKKEEDSKKGDGNAGNVDKLDVLAKEIQALREDREKEKTEKVLSGKRSDLLAKFKEKGIDEKWATPYLTKLNITADTDIEKEAIDALTLYNVSNSHVPAGGATPHASGVKEPDESQMFDDVATAMRRFRHEGDNKN